MSGAAAPLVSVVIPTFNRSGWLRDAIASVREQTFGDFEIIVVDDGSTDDTGPQLHALCSADSRIRYLAQANRGPSAARNAGIERCRGQFIALLDSDDRWLPSKLEKQLALFSRQPGTDVVYTGFGFMDESGTLLEQSWPRPPRRGSLYEDLMYGNVIRGSDSAVMVRAQALRQVGGFDETLYAAEDQDLWRRLALHHRFELLEEVLVWIRWHATNIQRDVARMAEGNLRHFTKMVLETPRASRHHLPAVARCIVAESGSAFYRQRGYREGLRFLRRFVVHHPRYALATVELFRVMALEILYDGYRMLPEPLKDVWRRLKKPAG